MTGYRLMRFSNPEILKSIEPGKLVRLLDPYRQYLKDRGFKFPPSIKRFNYDKLIRVLMTPDENTPHDLLDALYLIDELSTPDAQAALINEFHARRGEFEDFVHRFPENLTLDNPSPADVALCMWLYDRNVVERVHAEWAKPDITTFAYFRAATRPISVAAGFKSPLEDELNAWFVERLCGSGTKIFDYGGAPEHWLLIRHGQPYRCLERWNGKSVASIEYQPLIYDAIVFNAESGLLKISASLAVEVEQYRTSFGRHACGNAEMFAHQQIFSLEPLRKIGEDALTCTDFIELEQTELTELEVAWGGVEQKTETWRAHRLFRAFAAHKRTIPQGPVLQRAKAKVKFRGSESSRDVTVTVPNRLEVKRQSDVSILDEWLERRGFMAPVERQTDSWQNFCIAMETIAGGKASAAEWKMYLGDEFEQYPLIQTSDWAADMLVGDVRRVEVVHHGNGDYVGVDRITGKSMTVNRRELLVYRLDVNRILDELANLFDVIKRNREVDGLHRTWEVGNTSGSESINTYLTMPESQRDFQDAVSALNSINDGPFILVTPTARLASDDSLRLLEYTGAHLLTLCESVELTADRHWRLSPSADIELKKWKGKCSGSENAFRRNGKTWELAFSGKRVNLTDRLGLHYIYLLLQQPDKSISATRMAAIAAGKNESLFSGGSGPKTDSEGLEQAEQRIQEVVSEIQVAEKNNDIAEVDRLKAELYSLESEVKTARDIHGNIRDNNDYEKARKSVTKATSGAIDKIREMHPLLADHLKDRIKTGGTLMYRKGLPPIQWNL